jgi:hypothetical protein
MNLNNNSHIKLSLMNPSSSVKLECDRITS